MLHLWLVAGGGVGVVVAVLGPLWAHRGYRRAVTRFPHARQIWLRYAVALECAAGVGICLGLQVVAPLHAVQGALQGIALLFQVGGILFILSAHRLEERDQGSASVANHGEVRDE